MVDVMVAGNGYGDGGGGGGGGLRIVEEALSFIHKPPNVCF